MKPWWNHGFMISNDGLTMVSPKNPDQNDQTGSDSNPMADQLEFPGKPNPRRREGAAVEDKPFQSLDRGRFWRIRLPNIWQTNKQFSPDSWTRTRVPLISFPSFPWCLRITWNQCLGCMLKLWGCWMFKNFPVSTRPPPTSREEGEDGSEEDTSRSDTYCKPCNVKVQV